MTSSSHDVGGRALEARLEALETRIARLEQTQTGEPGAFGIGSEPAMDASQSPVVSSEEDSAQRGELLEFQVGQVWFSKVGILALAVGAGFGLSLPYPGLPAFLPSIAGFLLVGIVLFATHRLESSIGDLASFVRAGCLILFYFAALRFFYFGKEPEFLTSSPGGIAVLVAATVGCFAGAARYRSATLYVIALIAGHATAIIVPVPWFSVLGLAALMALTSWVCVRRDWQWILPVAAVLCYTTFLLVMLNRPLLGNPVKWLIEPSAAPAMVLVFSVILGAGSLLRPNIEREGPTEVFSSASNAGLAILAFFLSVEAGFKSGSGWFHTVATVVFLALATGFWIRERSRISTFVYAMTGYLALSVAISKFSEVPNVFVWLSLQSLVVVATAIWFQSRFIVAANFVIYLATIAGYLAVGGAGSGISFVFGAVALASARMLNWQKDRLHLQTELMRNGYLACGFVAFPYAVFNLVASQYVSVAWVGIAAFYYLMNLAVNSRKYRWMGHGTLLLTAAYLTVVAVGQLKPEYRILSFVVLGVALVGVSIVFSVIRARRESREDSQGDPDRAD